MVIVDFQLLNGIEHYGNLASNEIIRSKLKPVLKKMFLVERSIITLAEVIGKFTLIASELSLLI